MTSFRHELDAAVADARATIDKVVAALPHRVTPTYEDIAAMIEAGVRHVLGEVMQPAAVALTKADVQTMIDAAVATKPEPPVTPKSKAA